MPTRTTPSGQTIYVAGTYIEKLQECRRDLYRVAHHLTEIEPISARSPWDLSPLQEANKAIHRCRLHLGHVLQENDLPGQNPYRRQYKVWDIHRRVEIEYREVDIPHLNPVDTADPQAQCFRLREQLNGVKEHIIRLHRSSVEQHRSQWTYMYLEEALKQVRLAQSYISQYAVQYEEAYT